MYPLSVDVRGRRRSNVWPATAALISDAQAATGESTEHFDIAREQLLSFARGNSVQIVRRTPVASHPRVTLFEDGQGRVGCE